MLTAEAFVECVYGNVSSDGAKPSEVIQARLHQMSVFGRNYKRFIELSESEEERFQKLARLLGKHWDDFMHDNTHPNPLLYQAVDTFLLHKCEAALQKKRH